MLLRPTVRLLVAAVGTIALASCGIAPDSTPREIERATVGADRGGQAAIGAGQIFLVEPDASGVPTRLVSVKRDVDATTDLDPTPVLRALFDGPNVLERNDGITTVLPTGLTAQSWSARGGGVVAIEIPESFGELTGATLVLGLAQIVHTVAGVEGVTGVRITAGQISAGWPDVNGQLQDDPLTIYDYPGLIRTSQPAFPAVPSD